MLPSLNLGDFGCVQGVHVGVRTACIQHHGVAPFVSKDAENDRCPQDVHIHV